jgi:2-polyprenyl-3-methyl-5-hydroxy-6-metoxy-1,4-benzoquinol methylase
VECSGRVLRQNASRQWELFGQKDPYYGVLTDKQFKREAIGDDARQRFFESGRQQLDQLLADARTLADPDFSPKRIMEYGCGVGRLLIPAAEQADSVVGVDISQSMLDEARRNCDAAGLDGVQLLTPDRLPAAEGEFDFAFSFAVLIHVPRRDGEQIIARLVRMVRPGGVGAITVVLRATPQHAAYNAIMKLPLVHNVLNAARGREWSYPHMQMNVYNVNRIALILREQGSDRLLLRPGQTTAGFDLCTILFSR